MRYTEKRVKMPEGFVVGAEVGIVGEGSDTQTIIKVLTDIDGKPCDIVLSGGWRESLSKLFLIKNDDFAASVANRENWIEVAIGECDICGKTFPDSCVYHSKKGVEGSMICKDCHVPKQQLVETMSERQQAFIDNYVAAFCAAWQVEHHMDYCMGGKQEELTRLPIMEDAIYSAREAWKIYTNLGG